MIGSIGIAALGAFGLSLVLTGACVLIGRLVNAMDGGGSAGHIKSAVRRVPNIGGVAIFVAFTVCFVGYFWLLHPLKIPPQDPELLPDHVTELAQGINSRVPMGLALLGSLLVLHVVGLIDDRRPLPAMPKFAIMLGASAVFPIFFETRLFEFLDAPLGGTWASVAITVLWFAAVTNAINFMDNMDGLAGGVAAIAGALFLVAAVIGEQWFIAATLAVLVGSIAGFLIWNLPPAKIFMGDGGSLVIGFLLAFLTVRTTYAALPAGEAPPELAGAGGAWFAVFMPLCVLAVPIYDLVAVSAVRLSQGRSPMVGDEQHLSHRLRRRGLSRWQTLAVIYGCTVVTGLAGVMLTRLDGAYAIAAGLQVIAVLVSIAVFEFGSRSREGSA